jgi:ABC-type branched-subunit amino acid transport system substrate-binding protein
MATASSPVVEKELGKEPMFHHAYLYSYQIHPGVADALAARLGAGKSVALVYTDDTYGRGQIESARSAYVAKGFKIAGEEILRAGATDMRSSLARIRALKPEILVGLVQGTDAITLAKQVQVARVGVPYMVAPNAPQFREWQSAVGAAGEGWIGSSVFLPDATDLPGDPAAPKLFQPQREWEKSYRDRYGTEPDMLSAIMYVVTAMLLRAIELAGTDDKEAVAAKMDALRADTVLGRDVHYRPTEGGTLHQLSSDLLVFQRQGDKSVVIYPDNRATGQLKPAPWG